MASEALEDVTNPGLVLGMQVLVTGLGLEGRLSVVVVECCVPLPFSYRSRVLHTVFGSCRIHGSFQKWKKMASEALNMRDIFQCLGPHLLPLLEAAVEGGSHGLAC